MSIENSRNLKGVLLIDAFLCAFLGIALLFFGEIFFEFIEWPFQDPLYGHILGATFITYSILNFIASQQSEWGKIDKIVLANIIYDGLGAVIMVWDYLNYNLPIFIWLGIGVLLVFLVLYVYFYIIQNK